MSYENAARQRLHRRWWLRAVGVMACIVVFITVYALVLPAITMEGNPTCGLAEHEHTEDCYTADGVLICQLEEHTHDAACYAEAEEGELAEPDAEAEDDDLVAPPVDAEVSEEPVDDAEADDVQVISAVMPAPRLFNAGGTSGSLIDGVTTTGANDWQIVSGGYEGNAASNKTLSADGNVRVQKNVIPTDTENEFLVYLSIDTTQSLQSYFENADYFGKRNNDNRVGKVVDSIPNAQSIVISRDPDSGFPNSGVFTFADVDSDGTITKVYAEDITLYWDSAQMVSLYVELADGQYLVIASGIKNGSGEHHLVNMSEAKTYVEEITAAVDLNSVVDTMGSFIQYDSLIQVDGHVEPASDGQSITWYPEVKSHPASIEETTEVDGVTTKTTWYLNAAELIYKVKLDVTKSGFKSAAQNMNSAVGDPESYPTNNSAILNYGDGQTTPFPQPYVRGLLYDIMGTKVDAKTGAPLSGAVFTLSPDGTTATTDNQGAFSFTGLPWGDYTVTETAAPKGYKLDEGNTADVTLCYTTDKDVLTVSTADDTHMMALDTDTFKFEDQFNQPTIVLMKCDEGTNPLSGAGFTISGPADFSRDATSDANGVITTIENAENGYYTVTETQAPDGYNLLADALTIEVNGADDVTAKLGIAPVDKEKDIESVQDPDTGITTVTIKIHNNPGVELPATGGPGTVIFTVSGLALMAAAMIFLSKQRKRNHA